MTKKALLALVLIATLPLGGCAVNAVTKPLNAIIPFDGFYGRPLLPEFSEGVSRSGSGSGQYSPNYSNAYNYKMPKLADPPKVWR